MQQELLQLAALREEMTTQQFATKQLQKQAEKERNALLAQLEERQKLLKSTTANAAKQNSQIAQLANRASDLRNLLTELVKPKIPVSTPKSWADSAVNLGRSVGLGKGKWPIVGQMAQAYGQKSQGGAQSDGVTIAANTGGIVSSPVSGTVRFAGPFRQYKLLVIIEHAGQYHSLLGGLGALYTSVGQNVSAGEPIGKLATNRLYYEVRYRGQPTNPHRLIGG
jgi:murein hydrolase activator